MIAHTQKSKTLYQKKQNFKHFHVSLTAYMTNCVVYTVKKAVTKY